jgi:tRNA 2-thiouridine synthesizing protein E
LELNAMRVDKEGFLVDLTEWSNPVAIELAGREGIDLTMDHWAVIEVLRKFHETTGVSPSMRPFVKLIGERLGREKGNSIYLLSLFPGSPAKLAAKIAGLPRPTNCL